MDNYVYPCPKLFPPWSLTDLAHLAHCVPLMVTLPRLVAGISHHRWCDSVCDCCHLPPSLSPPSPMTTAPTVPSYDHHPLPSLPLSHPITFTSHHHHPIPRLSPTTISTIPPHDHHLPPSFLLCCPVTITSHCHYPIMRLLLAILPRGHHLLPSPAPPHAAIIASHHSHVERDDAAKMSAQLLYRQNKVGFCHILRLLRSLSTPLPSLACPQSP